MQLYYMTCFVTLVVCIHSFLVLHPKTVSQQSKLHELEDIFVSMSVISAALRYNINETLTWLHVWIRFPCPKPQPQRPMRCGLVIIQSYPYLPPSPLIAQLCTLVQVLHIRTLVAIEIKLENWRTAWYFKKNMSQKKCLIISDVFGHCLKTHMS